MDGRPGEGVLIAGRFRLGRCLGRGGMGEAWSATHEVTGRRCALKFLRTNASPGEKRIQRFVREARAASVIEHPGVIDVFDVFALEDGTAVMVMELLEGETLAEKLRRVAPLPIAEAADLLLQITAVLGAAHASGVVHRDVKPSNVFLLAGDDGARVKVLDFGIAKL